MADRIFVTQRQLESWMDEGKVAFDDGILTLVENDSKGRLEPAVRIVGALDGRDVHGLAGKVWSVKELEGRGAEVYQGSVVLGETAYEGEEGFVLIRTAGGDAVESAPSPTQPADDEVLAEDVADLADFLLKNL